MSDHQDTRIGGQPLPPQPTRTVDAVPSDQPQQYTPRRRRSAKYYPEEQQAPAVPVASDAPVVGEAPAESAPVREVPAVSPAPGELNRPHGVPRPAALMQQTRRGETPGTTRRGEAVPQRPRRPVSAPGFSAAQPVDASYVRRQKETVPGADDAPVQRIPTVQPAADKLSHLCICHAIHDLSCHKPYSIPDILRMNDFCVEVKVTHQHREEQDGSGWRWWERCSFEEFRDKFLHEAEQNRAPQIRLGQEIANRTRLYFYDYLEDLSADMPSVEQWTEPLSDEVHYRWRPQKDCFYLDENIDDYLRELYEFVGR